MIANTALWVAFWHRHLQLFLEKLRIELLETWPLFGVLFKPINDNTRVFNVCCFLSPYWRWKLCHYLVLDRFSCNSIGRGETSGYRKNWEKKTSGVPPTRGERRGEKCPGGNVLHPSWVTVFWAICLDGWIFGGRSGAMIGQTYCHCGICLQDFHCSTQIKGKFNQSSQDLTSWNLGVGHTPENSTIKTDSPEHSDPGVGAIMLQSPGRIYSEKK